MASTPPESDFLFSPKLLETIDYSNAVTSPSRLESNFRLRPLRSDDMNKGILDLLKQLTRVGEHEETLFIAQFNKMQKSGNYYIIVIEDLNVGRIVACATLFTEYKFVHHFAIRGSVEDVVVDSEYRGKRLGHLLIETLKLLAKNVNCYKLTLDCSDVMMSWYTKLGFTAETGRANMLTLRIKDC